MYNPQKKSYQILVPCHGLFEFGVDAESPEAACKILQKELRTGQLKLATGGSEPVEAFWGNPAETGGAWIVMSTHPESAELHTPLLSWDGGKITDSGLPPVAVKEK
jgi:hypothetical protein